MSNLNNLDYLETLKKQDYVHNCLPIKSTDCYHLWLLSWNSGFYLSNYSPVPPHAQIRRGFESLFCCFLLIIMTIWSSTISYVSHAPSHLSPRNLFVREFSDEVHWGGQTHHNVSGTIPPAGALNSMKRKWEAGRWHSSISDPSLEGYCILGCLYPPCLPRWTDGLHL